MVFLFGWDADWLHDSISIGACLILIMPLKVSGRKNSFPFWADPDGLPGIERPDQRYELMFIIKNQSLVYEFTRCFFNRCVKYIFRFNKKHILIHLPSASLPAYCLHAMPGYRPAMGK